MYVCHCAHSGEEVWGSHTLEEEEGEEDRERQQHQQQQQSSTATEGVRGGSVADYQIDVGEDYTVIGLPTLDGDRAYLGHFVNDGATLKVPRRGNSERKPESNKPEPTLVSGSREAEEVTYEEEEARRYQAESALVANAKHASLFLHLAVVAVRDIAKDEEVLVTYGADYWREHARRRRRRQGVGP